MKWVVYTYTLQLLSLQSSRRDDSDLIAHNIFEGTHLSAVNKKIDLASNTKWVVLCILATTAVSMKFQKRRWQILLLIIFFEGTQSTHRSISTHYPQFITSQKSLITQHNSCIQ